MPFPTLPSISPDLVAPVFTHKGYHGGVRIENSGDHPDSVRLAFLGDAVLQIFTTTWLWDRYKRDTVGQMTEKRARIVANKTLATWSRRYELPGRIRAHPSTEFRLHHMPSEKILGGLFEAYLAAVYLTGSDGLPTARKWIQDILQFEHAEGQFRDGCELLVDGTNETTTTSGEGDSEADGPRSEKSGREDVEMTVSGTSGVGEIQVPPKGYVNHLSAFNEKAAQKGWYPVWKQDCSGPEHHKAWRAVLSILGQEFHGEGNTIKEAKNVAAKDAWDALMV